jgi:hypothetical protein
MRFRRAAATSINNVLSLIVEGVEAEVRVFTRHLTELAASVLSSNVVKVPKTEIFAYDVVA